MADAMMCTMPNLLVETETRYKARQGREQESKAAEPSL